MKKPAWTAWLDGAVLRREVDTIKALVVTYVRERTLDPLKALGRFVQFGVLGSLFVGLGATLLLVGFLRFLQSQSAFEGNLSWLPYLIIVVTAVCLMALTAWRVVAGAAKRQDP